MHLLNQPQLCLSSAHCERTHIMPGVCEVRGVYELRGTSSCFLVYVLGAHAGCRVFWKSCQVDQHTWATNPRVVQRQRTASLNGRQCLMPSAVVCHPQGRRRQPPVMPLTIEQQ